AIRRDDLRRDRKRPNELACGERTVWSDSTADREIGNDGADPLTPSATHEAANLRPSLRVLERLLQPFGCRSREQVRTEDGGNLQGFREYRRALAPKERRQRALLPGVLL